MSTDTEAPLYKKSALEFKSTSFSVPVLVISSVELKQIKHQLEEKIAQAPEFFKNSPIVVDIEACKHHEHTLNFTALIEYLHEKKLIPVGICGGNTEQNSLAVKLKIPIHTTRGININNNANPDKLSNSIETTPTAEQEPSKTELPAVENMLMTLPIRSGQRLYAKGDLTILSHVSAGAEIMAEGNIHVYGALRGRALAGVQGNTESRIFCSVLEAELVSIAGHYKISEELDKTVSQKPTQIYLQDQTLIIKNI